VQKGGALKTMKKKRRVLKTTKKKMREKWEKMRGENYTFLMNERKTRKK
jgi:hypothetical protein